MNKYLFIFSISPVQSFIFQARKTRDLYAGSRLLSELLKKQIYKLKKIETNAEIVFPSYIDSDSLPNRFVAKIKAKTDSDIINIGNELQENLRRELRVEFENFARRVNIKSSGSIYVNQVLDTFESYWASVKLGDDYKSAYLLLEKIHAGVKNIRKFKQLNGGNGDQGRKCSLCGERSAYFYGDYTLPAFVDENLAVKIVKPSILFTRREALCSVCAMKRFYQESFPSIAEIVLRGTIPEKYIKRLSYGSEEDREKRYYDAELFYDENLTKEYFKKNNIPLGELDKIRKRRDEILSELNIKSFELPKYYALIMFDGDNMGKLLSGEFLKSGITLEDFHKKLSMALSKSAEKAKEIVDKRGRTVYAGGDDFLGFVPLRELLPTLRELSKAFKICVADELRSYVNGEITMSAGATIAHYKAPLRTVLNWAKKMEEEAKEKGGRNAFAIAVVKHSGEIHETVWKWYDLDESNIDRIERILNKLTKKKFSTNFIYALEMEFLRLYHRNAGGKRENGEEKYIVLLDKQFETELKRLISRSILVEEKEDEINELYQLCRNMYWETAEKDNYFELMKVIDFIHRNISVGEIE